MSGNLMILLSVLGLIILALAIFAGVLYDGLRELKQEDSRYVRELLRQAKRDVDTLFSTTRHPRKRSGTAGGGR